MMLVILKLHKAYYKSGREGEPKEDFFGEKKSPAFLKPVLSFGKAGRF
jgi:hypothetical protein